MIRIIDSKNQFGTMNTSTMKLSNIRPDDIKLIESLRENHEILTDENFTKQEKRIVFNEHRKKLGQKYEFDWHKMFMADQQKKDGSCFKISREYVNDNPNGWSNIPEDILMITSDLPGVVIGHPVADCPVVIMENERNGTTVVAHCSAELIDLKMPRMMVDALRKETGCRPDEIATYICACAGPNWTYDKLPRWATDKKLWNKAIVEENGIFRIDIRKAIDAQLDEEKIERRCYNTSDTISDPRYYSNSSSRTNPTKYGRQFIGMTYYKR